MLREIFEKILGRVKEETLGYYGERLVSLCVFGSVARGTVTPYSDIDLLIVAKDLPTGRLRRVEEFGLVEERLESTLGEARRAGVETCLSPFLKTPDEVRAGSWLFLDLVEDARILYDQDHFLSNYLENLKTRLVQMGAKRVWDGEVWHWVLTPQYNPKQEIEL